METIRLDDERLFGNLAAEDEDINLLNFYFVDKSEYSRFRNSNKLMIVRARKGMGKSALLRKVAFEKMEESDENLVIQIKGPDLVAKSPITQTDLQQQIYEWQSRICSRIALELGKRIDNAFTDDTMTLVENSEIEGFRERNIVGSLLDRFKRKIGKIELEKQSVKEPVQILERYQKKAAIKVWLFIDDIDATFRNSEEECFRLANFFTALRYLVSSVEGLYIRVSVRADVWYVINEKDESMDKVGQDLYMFDLEWSEIETRAIIADRVRNYLYTTSAIKDRQAYKHKPRSIIEMDTLIENIFVPTFPWGKGLKSPSIPIFTLSNRRPRWALQLCALAGKTAARSKRSRIGMSEVKENLNEFGKRRISDLVKEHSHQCKDIPAFIAAFHREKILMNTKQLLKLIDTKILSKITPEISGVYGACNSMEIAHFLFKIGFITAREDRPGEDYEHFHYESEPHLLTSNVNPDKGYMWEIHPCFRDVINKDGILTPNSNSFSEPIDHHLICENCSEGFVYTVGEQKFYSGKGLTRPKRCQICRTKKRSVILN